MAKKQVATEKRERQSTILDFLASNPGKAYTVAQLTEVFKVSRSTIARDFKDVATVDPAIKYTTRYICYGEPAEQNAGDAAVARYPDHKTEEGYCDPTAAAAIKRSTLKPANVGFPKAGDVWSVELASNKEKGVGKFIVIAVDISRALVTCIDYYITDDEIVKNSTKLYSKPLKYFVERTWGVSSDVMTRIRSRLRNYLGIEPTVEEATPSDVFCYTQEDVDLMLLRQKAEIYEECFKRVTGTN